MESGMFWATEGQRACGPPTRQRVPYPFSCPTAMALLTSQPTNREYGGLATSDGDSAFGMVSYVSHVERDGSYRKRGRALGSKR